ncbi:hypothetical protein LTR28_003537, partial [Elasticomyces elasticus]
MPCEVMYYADGTSAPNKALGLLYHTNLNPTLSNQLPDVRILPFFFGCLQHTHQTAQRPDTGHGLGQEDTKRSTARGHRQRLPIFDYNKDRAAAARSKKEVISPVSKRVIRESICAAGPAETRQPLTVVGADLAATGVFMKDNGESPVPGHEPNGKEAAIQVICLGSGGGPSEDDVTGLLVRSTATQWANNSLLAVDAGTHLASITRILQNDFPLISQDPKPCADSNGNGHDSPKGSSDCSSSASPEELLPQPTVLTSGPFAGLSVPNRSARANAAHIVRNHVSTYLITHPHLDHLSGFA